ncbi:MAG: PTS sugar transporter subunit IIA [Pseudomonadota bacterium]
MKIEDFLAPQNTVLDVKAADKARLIRDLGARAAAALSLDAETVTQALLKREDLGSTGVGAGVAIPHANIAGLSKPFGLFARLKKPLAFDAIDGEPVDLVFLLLQPANAKSDLNALAAVARRLREPDRLERLRAATDDAHAYQILST